MTGTASKASKAGQNTVAKTAVERGARILVLTDDPRRSVVIVPGCHIESMRQEGDAYFFEDGNALVGMIVEGGTVEYHRADRTYVVRLTDGRHTAESSSESRRSARFEDQR
ncbi:hypothetical protein [Mycobacterium gastri]|uniref:hypothetical protein n=1 Tax=Mycobacterium gastri TaxID=1777 RepID=UPI0009FCB642